MKSTPIPHYLLAGVAGIMAAVMSAPPPLPPEKLDYATPSPKDGSDVRRGFAGCFGALALLVGALFLPVGIGSLARGLARPNRFFPSDEFDLAVLGIGLGGVCLFAAYRWIRAAQRRE